MKYFLIFMIIFGVIILPAHAQMGNTLDPESEISFPVVKVRFYQA
jgi:hypothetical protein